MQLSIVLAPAGPGHHLWSKFHSLIEDTPQGLLFLSNRTSLDIRAEKTISLTPAPPGALLGPWLSICYLRVSRRACSIDNSLLFL